MLELPCEMLVQHQVLSGAEGTRRSEIQMFPPRGALKTVAHAIFRGYAPAFHKGISENDDPFTIPSRLVALAIPHTP